jgi:hypothetical protein
MLNHFRAANLSAEKCLCCTTAVSPVTLHLSLELSKMSYCTAKCCYRKLHSFSRSEKIFMIVHDEKKMKTLRWYGEPYLSSG